MMDPQASSDDKDDGGVPPGMHSDGDDVDNDDVETKDSEMTSCQAAATVASQMTLDTLAATALPKSIWHSWKMKTVLAATKCFLSLVSFSCLAGGQFHNIDFINKLTDKPLAGEASDALWYIVTAVQFSIAWCILMWLSEFVMTVAFFLRGRGELPDAVQNITDNQPLLFLVYDCLNLFMLSVAGFNMGAAASLPTNVVKLLIQTDFEELVQPVVLNCSDTSNFVDNNTMVTCPNPFGDVTSGTGNNVEHLNIYNLRAGVVMMLFLVWVIILSIVQDYVWLLLNPPLPEVTSASDPTEQSADGDAGQEDKSKDDVEDANEKSNDTGEPVETEVVADEAGSGDDI
jgi:hypothetical protein